jgi:hypothetical protein
MTLSCRFSIAECAGEAGQPDEAARLFGQLAEDPGSRQGLSRSDHLSWLSNRARWLAKAGRHADAASELEDLVAAYSRTCGNLSSVTLDTRLQLAECVGQSGETALEPSCCGSWQPTPAS